MLELGGGIPSLRGCEPTRARTLSALLWAHRRSPGTMCFLFKGSLSWIPFMDPIAQHHHWADGGRDRGKLSLLSFFLPGLCPWSCVLCQHWGLDKGRCDLWVCLKTKPGADVGVSYPVFTDRWHVPESVSKPTLLPPISRCCWLLEAIWVEFL